MVTALIWLGVFLLYLIVVLFLARIMGFNNIKY